MRELSRSRLVLADGREVYVEPSTFEQSGGSMLLAGTPNYVWRRVEGESVGLEARFGYFGAVIAPSGRVSLVPSPIDAKLLKHVRVSGRGDGTWDAVFVELAPPGWVAGESGVAARLWYGVVDGRRWLRLEEIPQAPGALIDLGTPAPLLLRRGDTLNWALPVETPGRKSEVVLYERRDDRWSYELVPTGGAAYVVPAYSDSLGLVLGVVRAMAAPGTTESNALYLLARDRSWRAFRRLAERVHEPSITVSGAIGVVSWQTLVPDSGRVRWELRTTIGELATGDGPVVSLDSSIVYAAAPVSPHRAVRLWVVEHAGASDVGNELRVITDSAASALVLTRLPNPFLGFFAAALRTPSELLIVGPLPGRGDAEPAVVTLLLRLRVRCPRGVSQPY